jgi:tetratricopeptide (TPR) repeat protein
MIENMAKKTLKSIFLLALIFPFVLPVDSQNRNGSIYNTSEDSIRCGKDISAYRTFFTIDLYEYALPNWLRAFNNCPSSSEMMYLDGVTMYRSFIKDAPEGPAREGLIDTLLLIYDRRMENFGGEGNILGRKGRDLLAYRGEEIEQVQNAYEMLKESVELEGKKSRENVLLLLISAGITLNKGDKMSDNQLLDDYFLVIATIDQMEGSGSRKKRSRDKTDEMMLQEDMLGCETLDLYFEPQYEKNKNDKGFLSKVISAYSLSVCELSEIYLAALEELHRIEPHPEFAHDLSLSYRSRKEYAKAASFLEEAVQGENLNKTTRAQWYYELALVNTFMQEYCTAIYNARESLTFDKNLGEAYLLLGDAFIASRTNLGDKFQQSTAFWVAADKYRKAVLVDPSLSKVSDQKLADCQGKYPSKEDLFFRDIKKGDSYLVEGCINEYSTVRSSN